MLVDIQVPPLGKDIDHVVIGRWYYETGDFVSKNDPIAEMETDKTNVELVAPASGLLVPAASAGESVKVGAVVGRINTAPPSPLRESSPSPFDVLIVIGDRPEYRKMAMQLVKWHKRDGDLVERGEALVDMETDKALMELAAPVSGRLRIVIPPGSPVRVSEVLGRIEAVVG